MDQGITLICKVHGNYADYCNKDGCLFISIHHITLQFCSRKKMWGKAVMKIFLFFGVLATTQGYLDRIDDLDHDAEANFYDTSPVERYRIQDPFEDYFDVFKRVSKCRDKFSNCAQLTKYCKKKGKQFKQIRSGCRLSCGFCKAPKAPAYVSARPKISSSEKEKIKRTCLDSHNAKRRLHQNTPLMVWNQKLADRSQTFAEYLSANNKFEHDSFRRNGFSSSIGENIYKSSSSSRTSENAVTAWYNEIKNYNFGTGDTKGGAIGHFTQVVWDRSTILGCGVAKSSRGTWVVARYEPAGNFRGQYKEHVHRLKSSGDAFLEDEEEMIL
ncbi:venom allergen 5-like isoform X2 [Clytia hemisphaerica]